MFTLSWLALTAYAGEGYWRPDQVADMSKDLTSLGITVPAETLANPAGPVLGSTVWIGQCTASFVSADGLLLTNAHCIRSWLEYASDDEHDLVRDGFVATERKTEAWAGPAARVYVPVSEKDVTKTITDAIPAKAGDADRWRAIQKAQKALVAGCETSPELKCAVTEIDGGAVWHLVEQRALQDVRIVYAPADFIAMFGGETDNWTWPRHSGDFALIRAWAAPDGKSAEHADTNVPYKPPVHLRVSQKGVKPGDPVMLPGYPVATWRFRTTTEIKHAALVRYPEDIALFSAIINILDNWSDRSKSGARRLDYPRFLLSNTRKNLQGMLDNFEQGRLAARRDREVSAMKAWVDAKPKREKSFGADLQELDVKVAAELNEYRRDRLVSLASWMPALLGATRSAYRLAVEREKADADRLPGFQDRDVQRLRDESAQLQRTLFPAADRDVLALILKQLEKLPTDQRAVPFDAYVKEKGGIENVLDALFIKPQWTDSKARLGLLDMKKADFESSTDPWLQLAVKVEKWQDQLREGDDAYRGAMNRLRPSFVEALQSSRGGRPYADANGSLRISFGKIEGYKAREAVAYEPQTTVRGMAAKQGLPPFQLTDEMLTATRNAGTDAPFADPTLGTVPLCFLASLENTGGNSGSPVLDARGDVVGIAFDRNYEGMAADWFFEPDRTRSIQVDVRFALWMLKRNEGAAWILQELTAP